MKKESILNNIGFVIAVITILLVVYLKDDIVLAGIVAGVGGFLYGFCLSLTLNNSGYIFLSIGCSLALSLIFYRFKILDKGDSFTFMICCSIFLLMLVYLIFDKIKKKKIFNKYSLVVSAEVVDLVRNPNTKREFYQPVYSYNIDGVNYVVNALGYTDKFIPKLGDKIKLYIDPNDYESVYFDNKLIDKFYNIGLCLFLMISSFIIILSLFL